MTLSWLYLSLAVSRWPLESISSFLNRNLYKIYIEYHTIYPYCHSSVFRLYNDMRRSSIFIPIFFIFFRVCCIIFCHLLYIHSGKTGNFFSLVLCSLWWVQIVGYVLVCRSYSFVCTLHHLIIIIEQTLSEDIELIKCLSDIICRVCE